MPASHSVSSADGWTSIRHALGAVWDMQVYGTGTRHLLDDENNTYRIHIKGQQAGLMGMMGFVSLDSTLLVC